MTIFPSDDVLEQLSIVSLLMLMYFYGSLLYSASCRISDGSEMLLLLYGPGIVGGLVIPVLGAIPDGAIILISGLGGGSKDAIQKNLAVGVGTLAGSTIMLITIPWALGVYLGRRDIEDGEAASHIVDGRKKAKYSGFSWTRSGVTSFEQIPSMAKTMMITSLLYLIIDIPSTLFGRDKNASSEERIYAWTGLVASLLSFLLYSFYQLHNAKSTELVEQRQRQGAREDWKKNLGRHFPAGKSLELVFNKYDVDGDGVIDRGELVNCLKSLGLEANRQEVNDIMHEMDVGDENGGAGDHRISLEEFEVFFTRMLGSHVLHRRGSISVRVGHGSVLQREHPQQQHERLLPSAERPDAWANDCVEDEDEFADLTDAALLRKALLQLLLGAAIVTVFSEPMVSSISVFADKAGINAFYVSFVVTPLASNASEVIAALVFAAKRNNAGISLTFGSLYGAANMNNTFAFSIFLSLIVARGLQWSYTAEVVSILLVTLVVGAFGQSKTIRMWQAAVVASLYPLSMVLVWSLKRLGVDEDYSDLH